MMRKVGVVLGAVALALAAGRGLAQQTSGAVTPAQTRVIVLDSHLDTPANLNRPGWSIMNRHSALTDADQVDYPRMVDGGVDGGFFAIYTRQLERTPEAERIARDFAIVRTVQIREMIAKHADQFALALTAADASQIVRAGKKFVFISMENGYPVEMDLSLMRTFRALGVTMMGPVHAANSELGDSATDPKGPRWGGLSPKVKAFVEQANRLGIVIDASHSSDEATRQMVELSRAPIILSHSGMRAVFEHSRNVPDDIARLVASKEGVIQVSPFSAYMVRQVKIKEREAAQDEVMARYGGFDSPLTSERRRAMIAELRATFDDFMKHLFYAIKLVGVDHVGISGDFDGGGGVEGLEDVTDYPKITAVLVKAGYDDEDVAKIWSGNTLRVLRDAQQLADSSMVPEIPFTN